MNSRWAFLVNVSLVAFAVFVLSWQLAHLGDAENPYQSIAQSYLRGKQLCAITNIWKREADSSVASGDCRRLDLMLPDNIRIFMTDMTGPTNYNKIGNYFWMTYYLFPREVGTSLDHVTQQTKDGFVGTTSESNEEILTNGFDLRMDSAKSSQPTFRGLRRFSLRTAVNPDWFDSKHDLVIAFLLPLLTTLAGMWLFRFLFPTLTGRMPALGQLAYSLGLGMMTVAAVELGFKLMGFHGRWIVLIVTTSGAVTQLCWNYKFFLANTADGFRKLVRGPATLAFTLIGLIVFLILFRIAGVEELVDGDAMRWMLKAKIMHLYAGHELVQWFSNPALAHAHLDYPTLVPSLHAATYDSIGHVDEFVTKFWPTWMLLLLVAAFASVNRASKGQIHGQSFAVLGLLLLPAIQTFVQWEGSTMPMIFFTVLGCVQCALWLVEKDRARLGLGLTMLIGAAMTKFEGFIFLALVASWIMLLSSARPSLKPSPQLWRLSAFCLLSALPFICLRLQIPTLNYESSHIGSILHHPSTLFSILPDWFRLFNIELARLFVNPDFANWNGQGGKLHWIGKWDGLSSLYNPSTLGLAWLCLLMTVAFWFSVPTRRRIIVWMLAIFLCATAAISGVFVSFVSIQGLNETIGYTSDGAGGRYLLPVLLAWFVTMLIVGFANPTSSAQTQEANTAAR
jgi:hypothetical protein